MVTVELGVQVTVGQGQDSRASTNRDRIRCNNCREYDHFVRDCPNSKEEKRPRTITTDVWILEAEEQTSITN